jgi:hypothetical protein
MAGDEARVGLDVCCVTLSPPRVVYALPSPPSSVYPAVTKCWSNANAELIRSRRIVPFEHRTGELRRDHL